MQVFWHRRDLRVHDNVGLSAATEAADADAHPADVVPSFVLDDEVLDYASDRRVAFLLDALGRLRAAYRERGSDLVVRRGDPTSTIPDLAGEFDADVVHWNEDYSGLARERDEAVADALSEDGVDVSRYHDAVVHEPGSIRTNAGDPYAVYTYFWRKWREREKPGPAPTPDADALADLNRSGALPSLADLGFEAPEVDLPAAGHDAACERLDDFCEADVFRYGDAREYPAERATARISQDLSFGTLGPRETYARTTEAMAVASDDDEGESVESFRRQFAWREFYAQVLAFDPRIVSQNQTSFARPIEWRNDAAEIRAWKRGETGYPIVDAGMRQLREEGWVHNRARMIAASFLTKDLLADWRIGYRHYRAHLLDHDPANEAGGWQWAASTGTDAQPYFRVFNPQTQAERYDPDAAYVTAHVPELADVPAATIHAWPDLEADERDAHAPDYPAPIVDHDARRELAIAAFEAARDDG